MSSMRLSDFAQDLVVPYTTNPTAEQNQAAIQVCRTQKDAQMLMEMLGLEQPETQVQP